MTWLDTNFGDRQPGSQSAFPPAHKSRAVRQACRVFLEWRGREHFFRAEEPSRGRPLASILRQCEVRGDGHSKYRCWPQSSRKNLARHRALHQTQVRFVRDTQCRRRSERLVRMKEILQPADGQRRVVIERVSPEIDCGRFPIKRVVGEAVVVEADVLPTVMTRSPVRCFIHAGATKNGNRHP